MNWDGAIVESRNLMRKFANENRAVKPLFMLREVDGWSLSGLSREG
jgi:hypothetical protein